MIVASLMLWLLAAMPAELVNVSTVSCKSVADCWLARDGTPIARPKAKRGRPLPQGDCGKNLLWLRHLLSCEKNLCVSRKVGDLC
jgi:hypothetical protein